MLKMFLFSFHYFSVLGGLIKIKKSWFHQDLNKISQKIGIFVTTLHLHITGMVKLLWSGTSIEPILYAVCVESQRGSGWMKLLAMCSFSAL